MQSKGIKDGRAAERGQLRKDAKCYQAPLLKVGPYMGNREKGSSGLSPSCSGVHPDSPGTLTVLMAESIIRAAPVMRVIFISE